MVPLAQLSLSLTLSIVSQVIVKCVSMFLYVYLLVFYSKLVNVTRCDTIQVNNVEHCQVSIVQDFAHVGQQSVHINIHSFANNLTIYSQMVIFHGIIAGQ